MFNTNIFKKHLKSNAALWAILMILPAIFIDVIVSVVAIKDDAIAAQILDMSIFASIGYQIPLIFLIVVSNKLVASEVQSGAITYVVTSSVPRRDIIMTKMYYVIISIFAGFLLQLIITLPVFGAFQGKIDLEMGSYTLKLFSLTLLLFATSGITFIASSIFNKTIWSFVMGAGVPIFFFLMNMLSGVVSELEPLKYLSINTLMTGADVYMKGTEVIKAAVATSAAMPHGSEAVMNVVVNTNVGQWLPHLIVLVLIGSGLYIGSGFIFCKKDLPL